MSIGPAALRVFLVDDHPVMRQGIAELLRQAGVTVVGSAAVVSEALEGIRRTGPDVALVDLGLDGEDGRTLLRALAGPERPARLVYSMYEDAAHIEDSLACGAGGYVTKGELWETLVEALHAVAAGQRYLSPRASRALEALAAPRVTAALSAREREVFQLLGTGYSCKEIALMLEVSPRTVESYFSRLQEKLGLPGMRELRRLSIAARR